MQPLLLINPSAGTADDKIQNVRDRFVSVGYQVFHCDGSVPMNRVLTPEIMADTDRIVVAGGDGSVHRAVAVSFASENFEKVAWGILPMGTGNDMSRMLGMEPDAGIETACEVLLSPQWATRTIDLLELDCDEHPVAINAISGGFGNIDTENASTVAKKKLGPLAYWMSCFGRTLKLEAYQIELRMDEQTISAEVYGLGIGNGRFIGGGFPITPRAVIDDGLLDITLVPVLPMTELVAAGTNFYRNPEVSDPRLLQFRTSALQLKSDPPMPLRIDGEDQIVSQLNIRVRPKTMTVAVKVSHSTSTTSSA